MKTRIIDNTIETDYNSEDVARAYTEPAPDTKDTPTYSKSLMVQYRRAKRASKKNDERSRKIVKQLTKQRKKMNKKTVPKPKTKRRQKTIFDFGGN